MEAWFGDSTGRGIWEIEVEREKERGVGSGGKEFFFLLIYLKIIVYNLTSNILRIYL